MRAILNFIKVAFLLSSIGAASAQKQQPAILSAITDGTKVVAPARSTAFTPAEILSSRNFASGGREIIVQRLALDPNHPVEAIVSPAYGKIPESPPAAELAPPETLPDFCLLHLFVEVFPGPVSRVRWHTQDHEGRYAEHVGWSNIDFRHLSGFSSFRTVEGTECSIIMSVSYEAKARLKSPGFTTKTPTFIPDNPRLSEKVLDPMQSLHQIYQHEGRNLANAYASRVRSEAKSEADLLANPPEAEDLIIRYRIAETPLPDTRKGGSR